ncbi:hypothetical protein PR003_g16288 [Phytophthora rubi]|uniref:Uncharacterized protein n=1 Tax=Phytophthora rubi TaxID=129364 RepID=A0A6A4EPM9_9STRA|nr:hypothetical protein PR003_g16288 [Phytophthora rubi]
MDKFYSTVHFLQTFRLHRNQVVVLSSSFSKPLNWETVRNAGELVLKLSLETSKSLESKFEKKTLGDQYETGD